MKKSELKSTLGSIKASDELIRRTVLAAEERKRSQRRKASIFNLNFGMRLAGAVCALMLTVGVMSAVIGREPAALDDAGQIQTDAQRAKEISILCTEADLAESDNGTSDSTAALLAAAKSCKGEWAIIVGQISYASVRPITDDSRYCLDIIISAERVAHISDGAPEISDTVSAVAEFSDEEHRTHMTDSIGNNVTILIEVTTDGTWRVTSIIY